MLGTTNCFRQLSRSGNIWLKSPKCITPLLFCLCCMEFKAPLNWKGIGCGRKVTVINDVGCTIGIATFLNGRAERKDFAWGNHLWREWKFWKEAILWGCKSSGKRFGIDGVPICCMGKYGRVRPCTFMEYAHVITGLWTKRGLYDAFSHPPFTE